jgi:DNA-binding NarL/FixJ family response regulator
MDPVVRRRLKEEVNVIMHLRLAVDDLAERVEALEAQLPTPRFARRELERQRRAAVLSARAEGLSIAKIAAVLGLGTRTVAGIVDGAPVPPKVTGIDGSRHPSSHAETHRNGNRRQA